MAAGRCRRQPHTQGKHCGRAVALRSGAEGTGAAPTRSFLRTVAEGRPGMRTAPRCAFLRWRRQLPPAAASPQTLLWVPHAHTPGVPAGNAGTAPRDTSVVRGLAGPGGRRGPWPSPPTAILGVTNVPSVVSHGLGHPLGGDPPVRGTPGASCASVHLTAAPWCLGIQNPVIFT